MLLTLGGLELLSLLGAADTAVEAAEGDALLLLDDVAEVGVSLLELQAVDGGSGLAGVLEVNTEVLAARLGGLLHELGVIESVSDLSRVGTSGNSWERRDGKNANPRMDVCWRREAGRAGRHAGSRKYATVKPRRCGKERGCPASVDVGRDDNGWVNDLALGQKLWRNKTQLDCV